MDVYIEVYLKGKEYEVEILNCMDFFDFLI